MPIIVLAHGALGPYDEIVFVSIAVVFIGMMIFSWFRSQSLPDDYDSEQALQSESDISTSSQPTSEHFELH